MFVDLDEDGTEVFFPEKKIEKPAACEFRFFNRRIFGGLLFKESHELRGDLRGLLACDLGELKSDIACKVPVLGIFGRMQVIEKPGRFFNPLDFAVFVSN